MTPARATGFLASATTRSSVESLRTTPSRVFRISPGRAKRTMMPAFEQIEIEDVGGLAAFPENVVGGVDGVVDGALVDEVQALRELRGRGLDGDVAQDARGEAWAVAAVFDGDGDAGDVGVRGELRRNRFQRDIVESRSFAGDAVVVHGVGAIGADLSFKDGGVAL